MREITARRVPRQERGERRVAAILDAAAALLGEVGYDAMTVSAVAARARVPIGSVYQFYPNKEAITQGVAERYVGEVRARFDTVLSVEAAHLPLPALLDRIIDPYVAYVAENAGYAVLLADARTLKHLPAKKALEEELVGRVVRLFVARGGAHDEETQRRHAEMGMRIMGALTHLAIAPDGSIDAPMLSEIKAVMACYLGPRIAAAPE